MDGLGGRDGHVERIRDDMVLRQTLASSWAVAVLEIVPQPLELILNTPLTKEEGPRVQGGCVRLGW